MSFTKPSATKESITQFIQQHASWMEIYLDKNHPTRLKYPKAQYSYWDLDTVDGLNGALKQIESSFDFDFDYDAINNKVKLKDEYKGIIIYYDGYRGDVKITPIMKEQDVNIDHLKDIFGSMDIKDVSWVVVTSASEMCDDYGYEREDLIEDVQNGEKGFAEYFEMVS